MSIKLQPHNPKAAPFVLGLELPIAPPLLDELVALSRAQRRALRAAHRVLEADALLAHLFESRISYRRAEAHRTGSGSRKASNDYCWVLGLRNSHDKTFPAGIVAGANVFVCDNLSFSGEVKFARKHTRFINRDLPDAHDLIIRACDVGVCSNRLIPSILHEWREPVHEQFARRDAWTLFNCFTTALKDGSLAELPKRTEALHGLLDLAVGLN